MTKPSEKVPGSSDGSNGSASIRLLTDVIVERGYSWSDVLVLAQRGFVRLFLRRARVVSALNWSVELSHRDPQEPTELVRQWGPVSWRGLDSSEQVPPFDFARIQILARDEDFASLAASPEATVRVHRVDAELAEPHTLAARPEVRWHVLYGRPRQEGFSFNRGDLWVDAEELGRAMRRPRLLADAVSDDVTLGDVLLAVPDRVRLICAIKPHLPRLAWSAHQVGGVSRFSGLVGPAEPLPASVDFAYLDGLEDGADVLALTKPGATVRVRSLTAVNLVPFRLQGEAEPFTGLSFLVRGESLSLTLADLWVFPDEVASLRRSPTDRREIEPDESGVEWSRAERRNTFNALEALLRYFAAQIDDPATFGTESAPLRIQILEHAVDALRDGEAIPGLSRTSLGGIAKEAKNHGQQLNQSGAKSTK